MRASGMGPVSPPGPGVVHSTGFFSADWLPVIVTEDDALEQSIVQLVAPPRFVEGSGGLLTVVVSGS